MILLKELLHTIESLGSVYSFESENMGALGLHCEQSTTAGWLAVDHDGTRAASSLSAGNLQSR